MPTPYIKKLAEEGYGSTSALEKKWDKAKAIAADEGRADDYATFPDMVLDASGEAHWVHRPLSEWTDNPTSFTVTLHGE